jgi:hypothetical protein
MSNRGDEWKAFSTLVLNHIENYTVPQYGDKPNDQLEEFSVGDCAREIKRYMNRVDSNSRGEEEVLRDLLKTAHYSCAAYFKKVKI